MNFWVTLGTLLLEKVAGALVEWASDYVKLQQKRKKDKKLVDNALKEKDPQQRAANIRDLLS